MSGYIILILPGVPLCHGQYFLMLDSEGPERGLTEAGDLIGREIPTGIDNDINSPGLGPSLDVEMGFLDKEDGGHPRFHPAGMSGEGIESQVRCEAV